MPCIALHSGEQNRLSEHRCLTLGRRMASPLPSNFGPNYEFGNSIILPAPRAIRFFRCRLESGASRQVNGSASNMLSPKDVVESFVHLFRHSRAVANSSYHNSLSRHLLLLAGKLPHLTYEIMHDQGYVRILRQISWWRR